MNRTTSLGHFAVAVLLASLVAQTAAIGQVATIENRVSPQKNWAAGSFQQSVNDAKRVFVNTRPMTPSQLSESPSKVVLHDTRLPWNPGKATKELHSWSANMPAGFRWYAKFQGAFAGEGEGTGTGEALWISNSIDVDLDVGKQAPDNEPAEDQHEMDRDRLEIDPRQPGVATLRRLPESVAEKRTELKPVVVLERTHASLDVQANGQSIFTGNALRSKDLTDDVVRGDLGLQVAGTAKGDYTLTAMLTFVDPATEYPLAYQDAILVRVKGAVRCNIDVDYNRDGVVDAKDDVPGEDAGVDFLAKTGALLLVNCDNDSGRTPGPRDFRDFGNSTIDGKDDTEDMSPISLELTENLQPGEQLHLVIANADGKPEPFLRLMDPQLTGQSQIVAGDTNDSQRMDNQQLDNVRYFPGGQKLRYDGRFLLEGLRFGHEIILRLEIRAGGQVIEQDTVRILNCPWLANSAAQPLANPEDWGIPANLANSTSFDFKNDFGTKRVLAGNIHEYVQDTAEWGYQLRRASDVAKSRAMIVALKLPVGSTDDWPMNDFRSAKVGYYGYGTEDEEYFENDGGDQGGNLECLVPTDAHPFGRICHGDTMTPTLRAFLARQKVQVMGGAAIISLGDLKLGHVDEVMCILPDGSALMPDWELAKDLLRRRFDLETNFQLLPAASNLTTYGRIRNYLLNNPDGQAKDTKFSTGLKKAQTQAESYGVRVIKLPGMFWETGLAPGEQKQRSFPRNVANSQSVGTTAAIRLIVPEPPLEGPRGRTPNPFLPEWIRLAGAAIKLEPAEVNEAWEGNGEAHCSSNAIREPLRK